MVRGSNRSSGSGLSGEGRMDRVGFIVGSLLLLLRRVYGIRSCAVGY
jgi:hypothetical protein